jgi:hypothetical protein
MSGANHYDAPTREFVTREELARRRSDRKLADNRAYSIAMPTILADTPDYLSPIDNTLISGRRQRKYDLESNNCHEVGPNDFKGRNGQMYNDPTKAASKGAKLDKTQQEQVADDPGKVTGAQPGPRAPDPDFTRSAP